jgi:hypothetical protein
LHHSSTNCSTRCCSIIAVAAERRGTFKKGIDSEQGRRNRAETRVQIRKGKKEENMMKRRMLAPTNTESQAAESEAPESASSTTANSSKKVVTVDDIPGLMTVITNSDSTDDEMVEAVRGFRRMLSIERDPPVSEGKRMNSLSEIMSRFITNIAHSSICFSPGFRRSSIFCSLLGEI